MRTKRKKLNPNIVAVTIIRLPAFRAGKAGTMASLPLAQTRLPAINKATTVSASRRRKIEPSASWTIPVVKN